MKFRPWEPEKGFKKAACTRPLIYEKEKGKSNMTQNSVKNVLFKGWL